jgi:hypothetical protein
VVHGRARIPQEKSLPAIVLRKHKEHTELVVDEIKGEKELDHEPPRKRRPTGPVVMYAISSEHFTLCYFLFVLDSGLVYSRRRKGDDELLD